MPDGPYVVSVIIAARNAGATIGAQLEALGRQRVSVPWEVVVADNGSTDETVTVAAAARSMLPRLRIVDASATRGAGAARNAAVAHVDSDILAFCDADDVVDDGWLAGVLKAMRTDDFVGCLWGMSRLNPGRPAGTTMGPVFRLETLSQFGFAGAGAMAVRREVFLGVDGFDTALPIGEDTDLSWRIQLAGTPLGAASEAIVHIRERTGAVSTIRQWYRYGRAERQLRAKFVGVPRADGDSAPGTPGTRADTWRDSATRKFRRVFALRGPLSVAPFLQRQARRAGLRWGRLDRTVPIYSGPGALQDEDATT